MLRPTLACLVFVAVLSTASARAQQPFFTDDADVAIYHRWHLETDNEYDFLQHASIPALRQDTQTIKFSYGPFANCEVGMDFPLIAIFNSQASPVRTPFGLGNTDYSIKYNFRKENKDRYGQRLPRA